MGSTIEESTHTDEPVANDAESVSSNAVVADDAVMEELTTESKTPGPTFKNKLFPTDRQSSRYVHLSAFQDALDTYNLIVLSQPDEIFSEPVQALAQHRARFTKSGAATFGSIATDILNAKHEYDNARRALMEWCMLAAPLLRGYARLVQTHNPSSEKAQKTILLKVATEAVTKMSVAAAAIEHVQNSLNLVVAHVGALVGQLTPLPQPVTTTTPHAATSLHTAGATMYSKATSLFRRSAARSDAAHASTPPRPPAGNELASFEHTKPHVDAAEKDLVVIKDGVIAFVGHFKNGHEVFAGDIAMVRDLAAMASATASLPLFDGSMAQELSKMVDDLITACTAYTQSHK
ncbi:hypothetical protein SPRG_03141 [Saprolegnia parasitica CBS 223.65]|uniref:Uncharacterized protein n=1 Tax=Saprolegnia parasitica (strain CBS 223.65) TaxID=695850 RepID=A0A067CRP4_SAPPC|nr:hypothetical protein SPRG_03141 [Saprolegnia parasitica CBS 223.65]KDO31925.1 hypothetical protein SPRG_03141 [Saprolegnia parasitica CBS 223.65]|eukprot:XP_012197124.1 hypothetical protein SPRG_03141 [Saprolegnia parasitica CBS 223.65]